MSDDDLDVRARARIGSVLSDKWTLETLLGVGGMAAVYSARHRNGARAAVKILHPELSRHAEVCERFRREGYAANRVEHPGVVKVLDDDIVASGPDEGASYIVMELLEGESLQDRLERGPSIGERDFLLIADAVLEVLEAAHARGVVHRDIKPENLFLLRDERASGAGVVRIKILDFGLARILEAESITTHGLALGTPSFMSPEQAGGRGIDARTDLFSLAATGFRLITGMRIHEGGGPVELVSKMAQLPAPPIRSVAPHVSEAFAHVIDRALEFRREDRYPSATLMRVDVEKAIAEIDARTKAALDTTAHAALPELSASALEPVLPPVVPTQRTPRRGGGGGRYVFVAILALAIGAVGAKLVLDPSARARWLGTAMPFDTPTAASSGSATPIPSSDLVAVQDAAPIDDASADALAMSTLDASTDATPQDASDDDDDDDDDGDASADAATTDAATRALDAGPPRAVKKRPYPPKKKPVVRPRPPKRKP